MNIQDLIEEAQDAQREANRAKSAAEARHYAPLQTLRAEAARYTTALQFAQRIVTNDPRTRETSLREIIRVANAAAVTFRKYAEMPAGRSGRAVCQGEGDAVTARHARGRTSGA